MIIGSINYLSLESLTLILVKVNYKASLKKNILENSLPRERNIWTL